MERSEGDMSLKNPVIPPGIDPGTVRLVAQRLNHYATPDPRSTRSLHYLFIYLYYRCKLYSYPVTQNKNRILTREKKTAVASLQK
jgi:hypothetical protein